MQYDAATMLLIHITSRNIAIESSARLPELHSRSFKHTRLTIGVKLWISGPNGLGSRLTIL